MGAVVSLDGFIADDRDGVGPLFDWYGNGGVASGRPFFAMGGGLGEPLELANPSRIVQGDRVTHLVYDVTR
jgi:hypothetical protein